MFLVHVVANSYTVHCFLFVFTTLVAGLPAGLVAASYAESSWATCAAGAPGHLASASWPTVNTTMAYFSDDEEMVPDGLVEVTLHAQGSVGEALLC